MKETTDSNETVEASTAETARRTFLKGTAAAGTAVAGLTLFGGSAAAQEEGLQIPVEARDVEITDGNPTSTITGTLTLTELKLNDAGDGLLASGTFSGSSEPGNSNGNGNSAQQFTESFTDLAANLLPSDDSGVCDVLFLNLGPLDLDALGLTVELSEVTLNIDAVPGPGNLLGNLLCAVANLLNQ
ncbi:hypothetical protein BRC77_15280 [Halobacteriales archaeon QH_8_64_26]|nr:MAG: hypothetical protein BRC77_15280 [Halobacteriales archaeon QH_8_64_26]